MYFVGFCNDLLAKVRARKGTGGREMTFNWSVNWASDNSGPMSSEQSGNMTLINSTLMLLPKTERNIIISKELLVNLREVHIDVSVTVTSFLGLSTTMVETIYMENKDIPSLEPSTTRVVTKVSEVVKVRGTKRNLNSMCVCIYKGFSKF